MFKANWYLMCINTVIIKKINLISSLLQTSQVLPACKMEPVDYNPIEIPAAGLRYHISNSAEAYGAIWSKLLVQWGRILETGRVSLYSITHNNYNACAQMIICVSSSKSNHFCNKDSGNQYSVCSFTFKLQDIKYPIMLILSLPWLTGNSLIIKATEMNEKSKWF